MLIFSKCNVAIKNMLKSRRILIGKSGSFGGVALELCTLFLNFIFSLSPECMDLSSFAP